MSHHGAHGKRVDAKVAEEMKRLGAPLPVTVAKAGVTGVADAARRILKDKGIEAYDATAFRAAVRQAIRDLTNPKRRT